MNLAPFEPPKRDVNYYIRSLECEVASLEKQVDKLEIVCKMLMAFSNLSEEQIKLIKSIGGTNL